MPVLRSLPMVPRVRCRSPPRTGAGRGGGHYSMAMQADVVAARQPAMNTFASRRPPRRAGYHGLEPPPARGTHVERNRTGKPELSFWQIWNMCFGFLGI